MARQPDSGDIIMNKLQIMLLAIGAVVAFALIDSIYVITPSEQGLILQFGQFKRGVTKPGIYVKMPIVEELARFDRRVLDYDADAKEVPTIDQKQLVIDTLARYQIVDPLLFRNTVRNEVGFRVRLANIIESQLRAVIGRVPLARVLTQERAELMNQITEQVAGATKAFGVTTLDVRVKRIDLPQANSEAIFNRMRTQREQEARKIRAEGKKDAAFIKADADKEARVVLAESKRRADVVSGEGEGSGAGCL